MTHSRPLPDGFSTLMTAVFERKAESVAALDVRDLTSYTDVILVITARSSRQVTALAEHLVTAMKKAGQQPFGTEGIAEGSWALIDLGDTIVHVFDPETRVLYNLEGLWSDADPIDLSAYDQA